ncbi:MAG: zinc-dependent metalloprotease [Deltaproteobacteria bacterium]|jgi:hypothetical protein
MKVRNAGGQFLTILGAAATVALGSAGCDPRNDDINRVQPGYVRKAIFQTEDEWHYQRAITHAETTNAYVIEGLGDWFVDRVKFKIQENVLIAYKPYEPIPGAGYQELEGNEFYEGPILAAWPIVSHFDIIRGYDPATNLNTNVIQENTTDQVWHEREYMRVNWATNLVEYSPFTFWADYTLAWFPVSIVADGGFWTNLETRPTDPHAARFSDDYVEYSLSAFVGMDVWTCYQFTGYSIVAGLDGCGFGEAKVRYSFVRIKEPSDYIPRDYPDSVVRKGPDGEPIYDAETGEVVRESIYNRFGFFRTETPTYDRGYGHTESGRLFRAMNFPLWKKHLDDAGNPIPMAQREPKPIIYYLNAEYPERYKRAAFESGADYNRIFSNMVADLKGVSFDDIQAMTADGSGNQGMFQIRQNDCNEDNIVAFVSENPDLLFAVERAVCTGDTPCAINNVDDVRTKVGLGNLRVTCTSLEAATIDPMTGDSAFSWQRHGDGRYSMLVWLNNPQRSGWGGLGLGHADARTGETVNAHALIRGVYYEIGAARVLDYIDYINGETTAEDIIYGQSIRKSVQRAVDDYNRISNLQASQTALNLIDGRLRQFGSTPEERLREDPAPNHQRTRLEKIHGTRLEEKLLNWQDISLASEGMWNHPDQGALDQVIPDSNFEATQRSLRSEILRRASPAGRIEQLDPLSNQNLHRTRALGSTGLCFLENDVDPHWAGLAIELSREPDRAVRFQKIADRLIKHVILHEIGHNLGLAHNFEGTYDALNYHDNFWKLAWSSPAEKDLGAFDEYRHTTVMEYMSAKGLFADFLGKYDEAALRFAYANQVAVFNNAQVDPDLQGGEALREWRYRNDYMKIPDHICDNCTTTSARQEVLADRAWVEFDPQNPPQYEIPFLFCDNYYNRMTPFCSTFDYGSNMREIFANYKQMWSGYFLFNNFGRDRLAPFGWNIGSAITTIIWPMLFTATLSQYYYYLDAIAPNEFASWDLKADMFAALGSGLNLAAEVVAIPEPVRMCTGWENPTVYLPNYYFRSGCDANVSLDYAEQGTLSETDIQVPLGPARHSTITFSQDYETWQLDSVGSYFDKSNMLWLLGLRRPTLMRFNYDLDWRNYQISLYRIFEPELRSFYDRLIRFDAFFLGQDVAEDLGSYWCRNPEAPNVVHDGYLEPRRIIDVQGDDTVFNPGPPSTCQEPAFIYPDLLTNIPYLAMFYAHALFSSDFDSQLDLGKELKIYIKGGPDDFVAWEQYPHCDEAQAGENCYCNYVDTLSNVEYRALQQVRTGAQSMACRLIERTIDADDDYQVSGSPFSKDVWRAWVERLEYARDLYRLYNEQ